MTTPKYFRTVQDIESSIQFGSTTENQYLDFKQAAGPRPSQNDKAKVQKEMCRDVTQFANHLGGCVLIGIKEAESVNQLKVASEICPVEGPDTLKSWIEQSIAQYCVPATFSREIITIEHSAGVILAINVPPSRFPIVIWDRDQNTMQAVARTDHGKTYLNPDELDRLRMNSSRAAKISFDDALGRATTKDVELVGGVLCNDNRGRWVRAAANGPIWVGKVSADTFELRIPLRGHSGIPVINIPYGLLRECWINASGQLAILINVHVIWRDDVLSLDTSLLELR